MILSRIGSSGMLVISINATSSSRSSRTPARDPAGAPATGSVSSTVSSVVISRTAGISFMLGGRERGYESWCLAQLCIVPSSQDRSCACSESDRDPYLTADTVRARVPDRRYGDTEDGLCDSSPNIFGIAGQDAKDARPFRTMPVSGEHPFQLLGRRMGCAGQRKRLSDHRDWHLGRHGRSRLLMDPETIRATSGHARLRCTVSWDQPRDRKACP